jgi:DNA/RNA endonuclease G (NUC1)
MISFALSILVSISCLNHISPAEESMQSFLEFNSEAPQDTIRINFEGFSILYDEQLLQPVQARYVVNCPDVLSSKCQVNWTLPSGDGIGEQAIKTSKLVHYQNNIWDRGHLVPVASVDCNCESKKATYTYLNCALQHKKLNQGLWKELESEERNLALAIEDDVKVEVEVVFFIDSLPMNQNGPTIPHAFKKTIIAGLDTISYHFPNGDTHGSALLDFRVR